ncbi:3528_t:CDS:2 [Cetraspora pellucida]|uniref:3528_t:CDS:1 n=1 Tax=Cetraspora pellucida TaxID=1433469 RepID=A0A9N9EUW4_9GLOM|nr:3528_t:CDS:2 [Cetraspora pellucida]
MENPEQSKEGEGSGQGNFNSEVKYNQQGKIVMSMIYSNFDILDKPWWKLHLDERNTEYLISSIKHFQQAISSAVNNESNELFWKGYIDLHREHYLLECVSAENDIDLTIGYVQKLLKKPGFLRMFCRRIFAMCLKPDRSSRLVTKVQNLYNVIIDIFPSIFFPDLPIDRFTPEFAKQLHRQIGNGLIKDAGQYRTQFVMAAQDNFVYMAPDFINDRMDELFRQCREKFGKTDLQLKEAIKYGACFLAYFLLIHPFINGNGRVARLLLSYLLSRFTVVPLSLYTGIKTRDVYLQCLREAQWYQDSIKPSALASFILECIHKTSYNICVVMDIDIRN